MQIVEKHSHGSKPCPMFENGAYVLSALSTSLGSHVLEQPRENCVHIHLYMHRLMQTCIQHALREIIEC